MEDLLRVGVISSVHGIKGEVKVYPTTDDPMRFKQLNNVRMGVEAEMEGLEITGVKFFKKMVILKFKGYDSIEAAEKLKGRDLFVTREQAVELQPDENFIVDLVGLCVVTDQGEALGTLTDVIKTGANDVYEVLTAQGGKILLPAIKECVLAVDLKEGVITVHIMKGLLD